jgi:hypothetical protein
MNAGQAATEQEPCTFGFGKCDRTDTRPYQTGGRWLCPDHTPSALAGQPEPDAGRYCLAICYCGTCPGRRRTVAPITQNVVDLEAIRTGKRRASPAEYRNAQRQRQEKPA